ncbi:hypothetical protein LAZ67_5004094 [Cordylochernes scorpioides]|uniref:Reverse transcriptase domain-containing protein n=1 Tax=Cordylochernes scorpioides TaxID=51811 RepID=A0ABY6KHP0_9ARAC|nr:hypothetical protein LAZ67_5004094 [Cordylochernes scorpioides]
MEGQILVGLSNVQQADKLVEDGPEIEDALLRATPLKKRAERIVFGNVPFFIENGDLVAALRPYGQITSIVQKMLELGDAYWADARREAFITLRDGVKLSHIPARLEIKSKGVTSHVYVTYGIRGALYAINKATNAPTAPGRLACKRLAYFYQGTPLLAQRTPEEGSPLPRIPCRLSHQRKPQTQTTAAVDPSPPPPRLSSGVKKSKTSSRNMPNMALENPKASTSPHEMKKEETQVSSPSGTPLKTRKQLNDLLERVPNDILDQPELEELERSEILEALATVPGLKKLQKKIGDEQKIALTRVAEMLMEALPNSHSAIYKRLMARRHRAPAALRCSGLDCLFAPGVAVLRQRVLWPGNISIVSTDVRGQEVRVINCYLSHIPREQLEQLESIKAAAIQEDAWVVGDLKIDDQSTSDTASGSVEALTELMEQTALVDVATLFGAAHLPTRVASCRHRVDTARLDRILLPSRLLERVTLYKTIYYRLSDHRAVLVQLGSPPLPRQTGVAAMLRSVLVDEYLLATIEITAESIADMSSEALWIKWPKIKAEFLAEVRSLHVSNVTDDDHISRAGRFLQAMLEAESSAADYPSLPDFVRWLRVRRPACTNIRDEDGSIIQGGELRRRAYSIYQRRFNREPSDPITAAEFIRGTTTPLTLEENDPLIRPVITGAEIVAAIRRLPLGRAPGWDDSPCEFLIAYEDFFVEALRRIFEASKLRGALPSSIRRSTICLVPNGYLPTDSSIAKLQARLVRFVWGPQRTAWLPGGVLARPVSVGGFGLLDLGTQLRLACLKGVKAELRGSLNAYSWLVVSGTWLSPPTSGTWLPPRRRKLLRLWEAVSDILELNHRVLPPHQLQKLHVIGDCRFLRPPDLLVASRWAGLRVGDIASSSSLPLRTTRATLADVAALTTFCSRLVEQNRNHTHRVDNIENAIVLRGMATPLQRLTIRTARRMLERPRLAALPITQLLGRWLPHVSIPISISWSSLRRCAFSGHNADVAVRLALHTLPHPAHPASARESCIACGSGDLSLAHRYWSCRRIRPVIVEAFTIIQRPPDLQSWIFGHDLENNALSIMASAKTRIYKYFLALELRGVQKDPLLVWRRTLSRLRTTIGDAPSGSAQGQPRVTGASSSAGAVVTADTSANRAQNWTDIIESSEADENGFIQPRRKRKRGGTSTPDSHLPRATATARTEVRSFNRTSRNSGGQTSSTMGDPTSEHQDDETTGRRLLVYAKIEFSRQLCLGTIVTDKVFTENKGHPAKLKARQQMNSLIEKREALEAIDNLQTLGLEMEALLTAFTMNGKLDPLLETSNSEQKKAIDILATRLMALLGDTSSMSFRIATLNVRGFAARHRSMELCCFLQQHAIDIAFVQEANVTALDNEQDLCSGYKATITPSTSTIGSGLACVAAPGVTTLWQRILWPGKIAVVCANVRGHQMAFVNCHLSHDLGERLLQLQAIAAEAIREDAWVLGDLNISEESTSDINSGSVEALTELLEQVDLVDAAYIFEATHLPTRVATFGSRIHTSRLDRILLQSRLSDHVTHYWTTNYRLSDHRAVILQLGQPPLHARTCIAAMLRSRIVVARVATLFDKASSTITDLSNRELWRNWTSIKANIVSQIKCLDVPRVAEDDYIIRASRFLQARLEAASMDADYPSLPDLSQALRVHRSGLNNIYDENGRPMEGQAIFTTFRERFSRPSCDPYIAADFLREVTTPIILENTRVSDEVAAASRNNTPLAVISTDLESAFDTLDRGFLISLLVSLWLPPAFIGWLLVLYAGADVTVRVKKHYTRPFDLLNGVKQGCAASAALFSIATGPLLRRLERVLSQGNVLANAYDINLLIRNDEQFKLVKNIFDEFRLASGVRINYRKCKGLWCGAWRNRVDSPLDICWSTAQLKVLGCLVTTGHGKSVQENRLVELMETAAAR